MILVTTAPSRAARIQSVRDELEQIQDEIRDSMKAGDTVSEEAARARRAEVDAQLTELLDS